MPLELRQRFCQALASVMHRHENTQLGHAQLEQLLRDSLTEEVAVTSDDFEEYANDIQTCSFLVRSATDDTFRFAHKSFVEFFVAQNLVSQLLQGQPLTPPISDPPLAHDWGNAQTGQNFFGWNVFISYAAPDRALPKSKGSASQPSGDRLRSHLESRIEASMDRRLPSVAKRLTPEIATFAIEAIENVGRPLRELVAKFTDPEGANAFCEFLRLARTDGFVRQNAEEVKWLIEHSTQQQIRIALSVALAAVPEYADAAFLDSARTRLPPDAWSLILLQISSRPELRSYVRQLLPDDLRAIDKLIYLQSLHGALAASQVKRLSMSVIQEVLQEPDDTPPQLPEGTFGLLSATLDHSVSDWGFGHLTYLNSTRALALELLAGLEVAGSGIVKMLQQTFVAATEPRLKRSIVEVLMIRGDRAALNVLKSLRGRERNSELKQRLSVAEKRVRDALSRQSGRLSWQDAKRNERVRDFMWRSLRSRQ